MGLEKRLLDQKILKERLFWKQDVARRKVPRGMKGWREDRGKKEINLPSKKDDGKEAKIWPLNPTIPEKPEISQLHLLAHCFCPSW